MNETLKTIMSRRSIRKYKQEQIKDEELQLILQAGKFAPSAMNQQPWHFTVIQSKEVLKKINDACIVALSNSGNSYYEERLKAIKANKTNFMFNAPTLIVVSGDEKARAPINDCSLAIENMFIAAESLGIGSCWIHALYVLYSTEVGKAFLINESIIPEGYFIVSSGAFGYKAMEQPTPEPRRDGTITILK